MAIITPRFIIKNLMRILTPEEIDLLTSIDTGKKKASLTKVLLNKLSGIDEVYQNGFLVFQKEDKPSKKENTIKKTPDSFVKEIDKSNKSHKKIKQKEILDYYKKISLLDIDTEGDKKDLKKSSSEGILINKKQS